MADALVRKTSLLAAGDSTRQEYSQDAMGNLLNTPLAYDMARRGRVYQISNAARQTALATGGLSFSDTAPAFIVDFPSGTTGVPLEVTLNQGGTVAGGAITVILTYDNKLRFSSGGTAITPRSLRTDTPVAAAATAYGTSPTAAAVGLEMTLDAQLIAQDVTPAVDVNFPGVYKWRSDPHTLVHLVGPASLVIYTFAATTQPSWFFRVVWAEFPSTVVV